jgi:hypothetical protein
MGDDIKYPVLASAALLRVEEDGKVVERLIPTRYMLNGGTYFAVDTVYSFPINNMEDMGIPNGSVSVIRVTVKKDTLERDGYDALKEFIKDKLKMCPLAVCQALAFPEVIGMEGKLETTH